MHLKLEIQEDYVRFERGPPIPRPIQISRARWVAFWQHFIVRGITYKSMQDAENMMRSRR